MRFNPHMVVVPRMDLSPKYHLEAARFILLSWAAAVARR
jgi:hypothetical protein